MIRQAVFLVGGKGTRLGSLTAETPKPLLEIKPGVRFLDLVLFEAARHGFDDILLLAGHLGEQVRAAYDGRSIGSSRVRVLVESEPMGTGGALGFARDRLDPVFLMANGDCLFDINLRAFASPLDPGILGRLALREVPDPGRYGAVDTSGAFVTAFLEKDPMLQGPRLINGGIYVLDRAVAESIEGPCSVERDIFPQLVARRQLHGQAHAGYFLDIGLPDTYAQACRELPVWQQRPCAFLDRDGVLNRDAGYTHRPEDLVWMDGAIDAVRTLNDAGYFVIVVTNQAGVARGYYDEAAVHRFHDAMQSDLALAGAHVDAFYMCPFHPDAVVDRFRAVDHPDRKPNPGMILKALTDYPVNKEGSFLIGDNQTDLEAAANAGIRSVFYAGGNLQKLVKEMLVK